jgi:hypothetical protein
MQRYCSTSQSPQRVVSPTEEEEEFTILYIKRHVVKVCTIFSCSLLADCATCNVISHVEYVLSFYISTSRSVCAVTSMAGFCISLMSFPPVLLLKFYLSDF